LFIAGFCKRWTFAAKAAGASKSAKKHFIGGTPWKDQCSAAKAGGRRPRMNMNEQNKRE
jgi:hypothetical protein